MRAFVVPRLLAAAFVLLTAVALVVAPAAPARAQAGRDGAAGQGLLIRGIAGGGPLRTEEGREVHLALLITVKRGPAAAGAGVVDGTVRGQPSGSA